MRIVSQFVVAVLVRAVVGSHFCSQDMCVMASTDGSNVTYTLQSQHSLKQTGWMAIGTGSHMAGSHMVIVWPNTDGTVTLSQRTAPGNVRPVLVQSPPAIATLTTANNSLQATSPAISFTMPMFTKTQDMIWAFASGRPSNSSAAATFHIHSGYGSFAVDPSSSGATPWSYNQKLLIGHAVLASVGFLVVLPFGALVARWTRTLVPGAVWFTSHWFLNVAVGGPIIITGVALGYAALSNSGWFSTTHNKVGTALLVLYFVQVLFGLFIHSWKPKRYRTPGHRPPYNYVHPVLGIVIIGLAFWQVRTGFSGQFFPYTGHRVPGAVNVIWIVWVVVVPAAYIVGLVLLPRQFRQEKQMREESGEKIPSPRRSDSPRLR